MVNAPIHCSKTEKASGEKDVQGNSCIKGVAVKTQSLSGFEAMQIAESPKGRK